MKKQLKLGGIAKHNQYRQTDLMYDPLRRLIENKPSNPNINTQYFTSQETVNRDNQMIQSKISILDKSDISRISKVSTRMKSLSNHDAQIITKITYIPLNCHLAQTNKEEIRQRALSQKYRAVSIEQKQRSKPVTPKTFQNLQRNISERRIVYVYDCNDNREYGHVQHVRNINGNQDNNLKQVVSEYVLPKSNDKIQSSNKLKQTKGDDLNSKIVNANINNGANGNGNNGTNGNANNRNQNISSDPKLVNKVSEGSNNKNKIVSQVRKTQNQYQILPQRKQKKGSQLSGSQKQKATGIAITKKTSNEAKLKDSPISKVQDIDQNASTTKNIQKQETNQISKLPPKNTGQNVSLSRNKNIIQHNSKLVSYVPSETSIQSPTRSGRLNNHLSTLDDRQARLSEYQQLSGSPGYNFKKYQQSDKLAKSRKSPYKYNIFSALDQQANLKCATGMCMPNELCASQGKLDKWK